jgi:ribose transport system ATP-binding protein
MNKEYIFEARQVCKSFGATQALKSVDIMIAKGEIRGLIGENGSGKSTFSSICAGIQRADSGSFILDGKEYKPANPIDAMDHGISMVVQEQGTIGKISVAANIFFGKEKQFIRHGILNIKKMNQEAAKVLHSIGADDIKPEDMIDKLSFEDRKLVELARALKTSPKLWIIDETTTALTINGRMSLYRLMRELREKGSSVLFISHDIEEIIDMCDSITILRDGNLTANLDKSEFDADRIKELMIGREIASHYYRADDSVPKRKEKALEARKVAAGLLKDVDVTLHKGEILGIGGLSDCGMHELGKVMFGLIRPETGQVIMNEKDEVRDASWAVDHGIAYVSKNRDRESMMTLCSIKDNICLPSLKNLERMRLISKRKEKNLAEVWSKKMEVKAPSVDHFCNKLSGGNKQKVVLAKWLAKGSDIMILDCPTRGIDIGTKAAIYQLIEKLRKDGKSILLISEELPELIGMSDRIIILKDGKIAGEFGREEGLSEEKLIKKMI